MTSLSKLSRREREIMEIVFSLGEATLTQILERVDDPPTRPALRSILGILEEKGQLTHQKVSREFVYQATESRQKVGRSILDKVVNTFFSGSLGDAVATHLNDPKSVYSEDELAELATLIESKRSQK